MTKSEVSIEFFGSQRIFARTDKISMPVTEKTLAGDVLIYVRTRYPGIPLDGEAVLITVNHEVAPPDRLLKANDTICFIPGIGGG